MKLILATVVWAVILTAGINVAFPQDKDTINLTYPPSQTFGWSKSIDSFTPVGSVTFVNGPEHLLSISADGKVVTVKGRVTDDDKEIADALRSAVAGMNRRTK